MKRNVFVAVLVAAFGWASMGDATAAGPFMVTADIDVGSGATINMMGSGGMGGSFMTGGGPMMDLDDHQFGVMMYSTMSATMPGMMGGQTLQQRMMSFQIPGGGTVLGMMAGGSPWMGGEGIIMGGTGGAQGMSGTFTEGNQVGPTRYRFTFRYLLP